MMMLGLSLTFLLTLGIIKAAYANDGTVNVDENDHQLEALKQFIETNINRIYELNPRNNNKQRVESGLAPITPKQNETLGLETEKRSGTNVEAERWFCDTGINWRVLGRGFHPRFIKETVCSHSECVPGYFSCQPYFYPIKVLSKRESDESIDYSIPRDLRNRWKISTFNITVGCECGHTSRNFGN